MLRSIVSQPKLEMIPHVFVSSWLDYWDYLFTCLSKSSLNHLQITQIAAAGLWNRSSRTTHITPIFLSLRWLPIRFNFKGLVLTYRALNAQVPEYICDLLHSHITSRPLRSSEQDLLAVLRSRLKTKGDHPFELVAPTLWNCLPLGLLWRSFRIHRTIVTLVTFVLFRPC